MGRLEVVSTHGASLQYCPRCWEPGKIAEVGVRTDVGRVAWDGGCIPSRRLVSAAAGVVTAVVVVAGVVAGTGIEAGRPG